MMESAMREANREIKFIMKPSTELALAFLLSWFGQMVASNQSFRIMSDMKRPDEPDGTYAGANLISELTTMESRAPVMIFTSNAHKGITKLRERCEQRRDHMRQADEPIQPAAGTILVAHREAPAVAFCAFRAVDVE